MIVFKNALVIKSASRAMRSGSIFMEPLNKLRIYFIGRVVGVDDAPTAYCLFPEKDKNILVGKGRYYSGYVKAADAKNRLFRVKITGEMPESYKAR